MQPNPTLRAKPSHSLTYTGVLRNHERTTRTGSLTMRNARTVALMLVVSAISFAPAQVRSDPDAVRLNNRGVAQMGQQFTERAARAFAAGVQERPKAGAGRHQRRHRAARRCRNSTKPRSGCRRPLRSTRTTRRPGTTWAWRSTRTMNWTPALASFQQAAKFDPRDADSFYFEGVCYQEMKQFDKAIEILRAGACNSTLACFGRVCAGARAAAHRPHCRGQEHFKIFQHLTSTKISAPIGLAYGEQGHYSTVTPVEEPQTSQRAMIPVHLVAQPHGREPQQASRHSRP